MLSLLELNVFCHLSFEQFAEILQTRHKTIASRLFDLYGGIGLGSNVQRFMRKLYRNRFVSRDDSRQWVDALHKIHDECPICKIRRIQNVFR